MKIDESHYAESSMLYPSLSLFSPIFMLYLIIDKAYTLAIANTSSFQKNSQCQLMLILEISPSIQDLIVLYNFLIKLI